jgi:hypothetical protein
LDGRLGRLESQDRGDLGIGQVPRQTVGAEQEAVARLQVDRPHIDLDGLLDTDGAPQLVSLGMHLGFLGRNYPEAHPLLDQGVILGECFHLAAPEAVRTTVPHPRDPGLARLRDQEHHARGSHTFKLGVPERSIKHLLIRALEPDTNACFGGASFLGKGPPDGLDTEPARHRTPAMAPHAIGYDQQPLSGSVLKLAARVLVLRADSPDVAEGRRYDAILLEACGHWGAPRLPPRGSQLGGTCCQSIRQPVAASRTSIIPITCRSAGGGRC